MELLNQLKQDFIPTNGIYILNANEAFTTPLRRYLIAIAEEANNIASTLLTRCTTKQLSEVVTQASTKKFYSAQNSNIELILNGISLRESNKWELSFSRFYRKETYLLSDLGLDDVLALIDLIEQVLLNF